MTIMGTTYLARVILLVFSMTAVIIFLSKYATHHHVRVQPVGFDSYDTKKHISLSKARSGTDQTPTPLRQEVGELAAKQWASYEEYTANQKRKLRKGLAADGGRSIRAVDDQIFTLYTHLFTTTLPYNFAHKSVLCLAARLGGEVRAFTSLGALALGVDLNPGDENKYVLPGDFQQLQFADGVFDYVFTNAMDHAFDISAVSREVCRVLASDQSLFILDIGGVSSGPKANSMKVGNHESLYAAGKPEVLVQRFVECGLHESSRQIVSHKLWTSLIVTFKCKKGQGYQAING